MLKGTSEAVYVDLDLTGVNYIKIEIGANWNNASDHSVVADAMLATVDYEPIDTSEFINRVEYYDEKLKAYEAEHPGTSYTELLKDEEYELLLLQRTFVSNATYAVLSSFLYSDENIETLQWFMNDIEALRLYIGGGKPDGSYTRSLNVLKNLYTKHKADLADPVNGSLYKKMMITLSLTHSADVYFWQDSSQKSDLVRRYEIYKKLYDNELLITDVFKNLEVEEMLGINLPATVTDIKADAFKGCTNLKEIYLNEHTDFANLVVENGAFANDENNRGKIYVATDAYATELNRLIAAGGNVEGLKYLTAESVTNNSAL